MALFTAWPDDSFVWLHPGDISIIKASLAIQEKSQIQQSPSSGRSIKTRNLIKSEVYDLEEALGEVWHEAGRCAHPQPHGLHVLCPPAPARADAGGWKATVSLGALPAPWGSPPCPGPHFILPWEGHQSLPHCHHSRVGHQFPTAMPWPSLIPSIRRCLMPGARAALAACSGLRQWGRPQLPGPAVVSRTTISSIQKGGFCQQPVRQQKHPGTILAEENRKSS